jgi:energy-coupling factor transporter ATP-binding protein EcfA2
VGTDDVGHHDRRVSETVTAKYGYFYDLGVRNVRCFGPPSTLALHRDGKLAKWTVILGDNGVGKTTLLQCLHALEPIAMSGVISGCFARAIHWGHWPGPRRRTPYEALARHDQDPDIRARVILDRCFSTAPDDEDVITQGQRWHKDGSAGSQHPELDFTMFACAYGAGRKPGATALSDQEEDDAAATLFDDQASLLAAEEWFLRYELAAGQLRSEQARGRAERIRETLIHLLPDEVDQLEIVGLEANPPRPILRAHTPFGWVPVRDLSLGYRTLMAWVVDFAARMFARYPDSDDPLAEPAVCMVDEIDLHLHPSWQRKLIEFLDERFPQTQFIVTAHSPLVVQAAEDANIAVLRREPGDDFVTIYNDHEVVRGWRVDQILTSDLFGLDGSRSPRVNELLRERASILSKAELDDDDRARLAEIDEQIPRGTSKEDDDAWRLIRRFADSLEVHDR